MQQLSIRRKFIFIVGGAIAILLFTTAAFVVANIANLTRSSVEHDVTNLVKQESQRVEQFFSNYGAVARTFLNDPFFQAFFISFNQRGATPQSIPNMSTITSVFTNISSADDNIKSAFFASNNTGEYFYENGAVGVDAEGPNAGDPAHGYFANKRPWYNSALEKGKFYVSPPAVDSQDNTISAVVQSPIYNNGQLIGVGGVDILISTIGEVIDKIRFNGEGTAFLLDEEQNIVYFPKQSKTLELSQAFSSFDTVFNDTEGFAELAGQIKGKSTGLLEVTWKGEDYIAVFNHARLENPQMNWSLGILIPASMVDGPINSAITVSTLVSLLIIAIITAVTYMAASRITYPLKKLKDVMTDIASGDGDLTKTIDIQSNDEVGMLASQFNTFTEKLRKLLRETANNTQSVANAAVHLRDVSHNTNEEIQQEKHQVDSVTTAVTEMAATVLEISKNASMASEAADDAEHQAVDGTKQAQQAMKEIDGLATSIHEAADVVSGLSKESESIGAVVDVINSIAEQTNLLALNAAIEAARAGEQGRGFAVVADEVRSLASRTQESTDDIRKMVERLQNMAQQTDSVMKEGNEKTEQGVEQAQKVVDALQAINHSIKTVQDQSRSIAVATEQQTVVAENINESLVAITDLSDVTANHAGELAEEAEQLQQVSTELQGVVSQFKVLIPKGVFKPLCEAGFCALPACRRFSQAKQAIHCKADEPICPIIP